MSQEWCTIESDPGVFNELIYRIGVKNVGVEEIYSLQDDYLVQQLQPIYGLIFLFKYTNQNRKRECMQSYDNELFYANQVISNACATQAILGVIMNCESIDIGSELSDFKQFSRDMDSQMKGLSISNQQTIREVHNSFNKPDPFFIQQDKVITKDTDDVYHFITYVPFRNRLYELDGLQDGPILLAQLGPEQDWLQVAKYEINKRMVEYSQNEIGFNLLAINADKEYMARIKIQKCLNQIQSLLQTESDDYDKIKSYLESHSYSGEKAEKAETDFNTLKYQIEEQYKIIQERQYIKQMQQQENVRRRHNYVPLIIQLLKLTAMNGCLQEQVQKQRDK